MADEVQISNVGGDGVASEVTLLALVAAMEKMGGGKGKGGAAAKVQELHNRSITAGTSTTNKNTAATSKAATATAKATEATGKFAKTIAGATGAALGKLAGSIIGFKDELLGGAEDISSFARHLPLIGGYLGSLTGMIDENINSFRSLSQVGATFGDGLNDIRATAARAGIPLGEFTDLISQNATSMKFFGGTTASGAIAFASMSKELRNGPGKRLMSLGYTAQDLNESLIEYAEFSQTQIAREGRQDKLSADGAAAYLETIDSLATITGKRRDQVKAEMQDVLNNQRNRLAIAMMTKEEGERFAANMSQTPKALQDVMTDMSDGIANSEIAQGLTIASQTFRDQAANIKNMDEATYNNFMVKVRNETEQYATGLGKEAVQGIMNTSGPLSQAFDAVGELKDKTVLTEEKIAEAAAKRLKETTKDESLKGFSNAIRDLRTGLMDTFISSGVLKTIQDAFNDLAAIIGTPEFKAGLKAGVEMLLEGVKLAAGAIKSVFTFLSEIGDTFGTAGVIAAVVAGIGALFAAKAVVGALTSKVGGAIKEKALSAVGLGSTSPGTTSGKTGSAGKGAGDAIGNIGKGLGKGLGGILKGLAGGISAFANPTVALGAAGLAAAIVLIGGAIAGATWMVGASLPKMAEGLKSFETLDGQKLIDAGKGMGAIALGMAAFGAGSAVAGLGSLVGGISQGLVSMFGGDDPLTKMLKFQEYNFDRTRIENNAAAMVAYSKGMAALGGADAISGMGAAVGAVGGAIASLFGGGDDPLTKMTKFQEYTFDTAKIEANSAAVVAYQKGMSALAGADAISGMGAAAGAVGGAIASLFGGGKGPFDDLIAFQTYKFDTASITNNAGAVSAFAAAMENMPEIDITRTGGVFGAIAGWFAGDTVMPWDSVKAFGDANINAAGVTNNAAAINAMSTSLNNFSVEKLDTTGIISYTSAMKDLVKVLGKLNDELGKDNNGMLTAGKGENAGSVMSKVQSVGGGGGSNDQLNSIMNQVLLVLNQMRDLDDKVEKNTRNIIGSNLAQGGVSKVGR